MSFDSLIGQQPAKAYLRSVLSSGRRGHAFLFKGPAGVGKRTAAYLFAQRILCSKPSADETFCGECRSCRWFAARSGAQLEHPDMITLIKRVDGEDRLVGDHDPIIRLETVQHVCEQLHRSPVAGKYRAVIVPEAQRLCRGQAESANAFLKTLEEPPAASLIVLTSSQPEALLETIVSRVQAVTFKRLSVDDVRKGLARHVAPASSRRNAVKIVGPTKPEDPLLEGYHYRGHLPHFKLSSATYFITFRLEGTLPQEVLRQMEAEREQMLKRLREQKGEISQAEQERLRDLFSEKVEQYLDAGKGECWLARQEIAAIVSNTLTHFDGQRYELHAWTVMPNHVHVIVTPLAEHTVTEITHSWKSFSAHEANRALGRSGAFWQKESYDHVIRDEDEFRHWYEYIGMNPVKARLCDEPEKWTFSSFCQEFRRLEAGATVVADAPVDPEIEMIARLCDGSLGRAFELLEGDLKTWRAMVIKELQQFNARSCPQFGLALWATADAEGQRLFQLEEEAAKQAKDQVEERATSSDDDTDGEGESKTETGWKRYVFRRMLELCEVCFRDGMVQAALDHSVSATDAGAALLQPDQAALAAALAKKFGASGCMKALSSLRESLLAVRLYVRGDVVGRALAGKLAEALQ